MDEIKVNDEVAVYGAPGYEDGFSVRVLLIAAEVDDRGPLAVVVDEAGEMHVIPVEHLW